MQNGLILMFQIFRPKTSRNSTEVEHSSHHHKVEGLSPAVLLALAEQKWQIIESKNDISLQTEYWLTFYRDL
jgi:hypothetical protein